MALPWSLPTAEMRLKYDVWSYASMGNKTAVPQIYHRRINTPVGCGLLVPTACTGEGNSPPRRQNVPCSSTRSSGEVSSLQLCLVGFPSPAFSLRRSTVLEHAPNASLHWWLSKEKKNPRNPRKSWFRSRRCASPILGGRAVGGRFRDPIEGHQPPAGFPLGFLVFSITHMV